MNVMKKSKNYLIALVAIMTTSLGAFAQSGTTPLVGSTHNYTITPQSTLNTLLWSVVEASGYTINSQTIVTTTSVANIKWTAAGTYHLQFKETNGSLCFTSKEMIVTVGVNTFDVSTANPAVTCNAASGQINYSGTTATTVVTYKVDMTTGTTFSPNWEIKFTLAPGTASLANVKAGATSLTPVLGVYTATGLTSTSGTGAVNITMDVTGDQYIAQTVLLTITSAKELTYNTPDVDTNDWTATQTISAVPNTSTIATD